MKWFFRRKSKKEDSTFELFDLVILFIAIMLAAILFFAVDVLF